MELVESLANLHGAVDPTFARARPRIVSDPSGLLVTPGGG
jgi:hypothetical protein